MNTVSSLRITMSGKIALLISLVLSTFFSFGQNQYPIVRTPENVAVNYELPKDRLGDDDAIPVSFSKIPTDEEIYRVHFFEEPLVPATNAKSDIENLDFVSALIAYSQRNSPDDFSSLQHFLERYPKSRWKGSLLANLGIIYRRTGYYNQAMDAWGQSWNLLKNLNEPKAKALADRVVSELLLINAWVGRVDSIENLFKQIDQRPLTGPAVPRISGMRRAYYIMKNKPGISFKCGPYALNKLYSVNDTTKFFSDEMIAVKSSTEGFSLSQLQAMSGTIKLKYQMAFRNPGAPVILKSVVHWKLGHYSALLKGEDNKYECEDATAGTAYGQRFWLTAAALDSSASGYFLVPAGPLPNGWRIVSTEEGNKVFGKGHEPPDDGMNVKNNNPQMPEPCGGVPPMAQCNVHGSSISLHIYDRPLYYTPPKGPAINWNVSYHQRDSYQPASFNYSSMGDKWTFDMLSFVQDDPTNPSANAAVYAMGGGATTFISYNTSTQKYAPDNQSGDVLVRVCASCYELRHNDGSKEVYARPDGSTSVGRRIFLTQIVDAAGNALVLTYDAKLRIISLKDALGQVTKLTYGNTDIYKITKVTDPFGRSASFQYNSAGLLSSITDMIGIVSSFQYGSDEFISKMTTPYGSTTFTTVEDGEYRAIQTYYPLGEQEKIEYSEHIYEIREDTVPANMDIYNGNLFEQNTLFWDKKAMRTGKIDYTTAKIYHWLRGSYALDNGKTSAILSSVKEPLEGWVWYNYQNQTTPGVANPEMSPKPSKIGRVLDDDSTQLYQYTYNDIGSVTGSIDPSGRKFSYTYDTNKVDLLTVWETKGSDSVMLAKFTYNTKHLPLTAKDASGMTTTYTYNPAGQLTTVKNPKKETTTFAYNAKGYLTSITGPVAGSTVSFAYDGYGRVRTVTDPEGYKITTDYDVLDRPTLVTYPDSSFEQIVYNRLDAVHTRDRLGRWSHAIYDSLRRQNAAIDALGRVTQFIWCSCGSLSEIVDPMKNITTFTRDLQGRVVNKTFPDGKSINYTYENSTSRLKSATDAKGQTTNYAYFVDDNLKKVSYTNAQTATAGVSYAYDPVYNRISTMTDGTGVTKYAYKAANSGLGSLQLKSEDGPLSNDIISYGYDSLGRINSRTINSSVLSVVYDKLGRVTSETNALGAFGYAYVNQTRRLASMTYPNGQSTVYDYYSTHDDERVKQIWNKKNGGSTLSKFGYEYNREGQITKWTQQSDSTNINYYELGYDLADQLIGATLKNQSTSAIVKRYAYQYDNAGNRTSEQIDNAVTSAVYNNLNQLTGRRDNGPIRVKGTVNEFSSVLVKNTTTGDSLYAPVDSATNAYEAFVRTVPGTNSLTVSATDYSGNSNKKINSYSITVNSGVKDTLTFDANGNTLTESNPAVTYGWDAADRLIKITKGSNVTEFVYDGLSRRVAEKLNGSVIKRWLWVGTEAVEERDAGGGTVTKRFFKQGEQISGTNYYFTKDHLGSVIEMTDASGVVKARYSYDPYGRRTKISGSVDADFGFTGHYYHAASGLHLALYRAYDANLGRWLNRDPIQEIGGINLYQYVKGKTLIANDPDGRFLNFVAGAVVGGGINLGVQLYTNGGNLSQVDWKAVGINAAFGATGVGLDMVLGSAAETLAGSILASTLSGAITGAANQAAMNYHNNECLLNGLLGAALINGGFGGLGKIASEGILGAGQAFADYNYNNLPLSSKLFLNSNAIQSSGFSSGGITTSIANGVGFAVSNAGSFF